jgi:hypothetical protein
MSGMIFWTHVGEGVIATAAVGWAIAHSFYFASRLL